MGYLFPSLLSDCVISAIENTQEMGDVISTVFDLREDGWLFIYQKKLI